MLASTKTIFVLLTFISLLAACSTNPKIDPAIVIGRTVYAIPVGKTEKTGIFSTGIGALLLGPIGAAIEGEIVKESSALRTEILESAFLRGDILEGTGEYIGDRMLECSKIERFELMSHSLKSSEIRTVFYSNSQNKIDNKDLQRNILIEYGIPNLFLANNAYGVYVFGNLGVRIVNPNTGIEISKAFIWKTAEIGGEKVIGYENTKDIGTRTDLVKAALTRLTTRMAKEAISDLGILHNCD